MSNVAIIDQEPCSQAGIEAELVRTGHMITGVASNGIEGLELVRRTQPNLVVLDLDIPSLGGLDVIRRLISRQRDTRILVFTAFPADVYEHLCMSAGALGFVSKYDSLTVFADAVVKVLSGKTYFNASALRTESAEGESPEGLSVHLTAREITVLHYLADGMRVKDIAGQLAISDRTVSTYKARLLEKTNTHSLVELLRLAAQRGLVTTVGETAAAEPVATSSAPQFNALFDQIPYPICLRDAQGCILAANQALERYFGISAGDLLGTRPVDAGLVELEHYEYARKTYEAAVEKRIPYMLVLSIMVHGERRVIKSSGLPVMGSDGTFLGMLCTSVDIGEQQKALETLQEQLAYSRALRQRRGQYLVEYCNDMTLNLSRLKAMTTQPGKLDANEERQLLVCRLQEHVDLLAELVRLEQGLVSPTSYVNDLGRLTRMLLEQAPAGSLPVSHLHCAGPTCWGWIDADRYVQLLRILLLHAKRLGAANLDLYADSQPLDIQQISWRLRIVGVVALQPDDSAPSIRWLLAQQIARLLVAELDLTLTASKALEINLLLQVPRAVSHPL